ncbi:MAG: SusC/RagA family TonB-linked outer membrane protein [Candidatus Cyclobacteriaceae bacterium M3_2C_046]
MKNYLLVFFIVSGLVNISVAQKTITGKVLAYENEQPLPGANVVIKDTSVGTVTDLSGNFSLEVPTETNILVVSYIGYLPEEITLNNQTNFEVMLVQDVTQLEELVVVGYGSTSRKLVSGSISQIDAEDFEDIIKPSLDAALQGKTTGVQINSNSGTPGAALSVEIRGANSISAGTQPLYVIDGIPITTGDFAQIGMEGQNINALSDIDPDDIASITVLKDASSAAIYGARAANGVVLIETKSGKSGQTRINLSAYTGVQTVQNKLDLLNASEFIEYLNDVSAGLGDQFDPSVNTDWQNEVLRTAPIHEVELNLSGGTNETQFYISGGFFQQEGIVIGTDYTRFNGRVNVDHSINERFRIGAKVTTSRAVNNRVPGDQSINGVLPNSISKPPVYQIRDEEGNYLEQGFWPNPVAIGNEALNELVSLRNITNVYGEYDLIPELTFRTQWGYDFYNLDERRYEPTTTDRGAQSNGYGIDASTRISRLVQQSTLNYQQEINNHDFSILAGYSFEVENEKSNYLQGVNFPTDDFQYISEAGTVEETAASASDYALQSIFGRINYIYDNRYIITFNFRRDGSSNFGSDNRYANFPGGSVAWNISEEDFFNAGAVENLKIRAGYGLVGNDNIGRFQFLNTYSGGFNYLNNPGIVPSRIPNPDLKWESSAQANLGVDLSLWQGRLSVSTDVYYNRTTDLLLDRPLPGNLGFSSVAANVGELENKGLEIGLDGVITEGAIKWNSNFNVSFNRNKVISLYEDQPILNVGRGNNAVLVNQPIGVFYQLRSQGVDPSTGDLVFEDVDFNNEINDQDRQVVGDPNPDFSGGFTNRLAYKNFDLSLFLQFVYGNEIFNGVRQYAENMTFEENDNQLASIKQRWRQPGDRVPIPRINGIYNNDITSHYIEDGSFMRLKNVTLGYTLPKGAISGLTNLRLYITGQNLFTLTRYSGYDPEVNYSGIGSIRRGVDFFTFPLARTITLGAKISF